MECVFVNRAKGPLLSVYVDDIKLVGKKQNIEPTWKVLMEDVDLGLETRMGESTEMGMPTCASSARSIPVCTRG